MPLVLVFGGFTSFETLAKLRRVYRHHLSSVQNLLSDISFYWLVHDGILTMVYYHPYQNDPHFTPCINNTQQAGSTAHCLIWHWHHPMVRKSSLTHLCVLQLFQGLSQLLLQGPSFLQKTPGWHRWNLWQKVILKSFFLCQKRHPNFKIMQKYTQHCSSYVHHQKQS